jgi:hypothetical protein
MAANRQARRFGQWLRPPARNDVDSEAAQEKRNDADHAEQHGRVTADGNG